MHLAYFYEGILKYPHCLDYALVECCLVLNLSQIIVGIPFPNVNDIQVAEKKKFNDTYKSSKKLISGNEWYCQQAFRAVNQASGRCIRHKFDYGAIIYLDERFSEDRNRASISKWFRKSIKQYDDIDTPLEDLSSFFRDVKNRVGKFSDSVKTLAIDVKGVPCVQENSRISRKKSLQGKKTNQLKDKLKSNDGSAIEQKSQMLQTSYPVMNSPTHVKEIQVRPCAYEYGSKGSLANINLIFDSDEESRMYESPLSEQSPGAPDLIMVNETPCPDDEMAVATPESFSKNHNSFLSVHPSTVELPEQSSEHFSLTNSSPDLKSASLVVTPERDVSADLNLKEVTTDSSFSWSVNSHVQKRRKSYGLSTANHLREEHMRNSFEKTTSLTTPESFYKNQNSFLSVHPSTVELPEESSEHFSLINSSPDLKSASLMVTPERNVSEDVNVKEVKTDSSFYWSVNSHVEKRRKSYGLSTGNHIREEHMRNPLVKTPSSSHMPHLAMNQHFRINCSNCRNPLGLPKNNLFVTCMLTSSTKAYLKSLREASLRSLDVPVVICDVSSVDERISNGTNDASLGEEIWCKEDGCVFKPVFCPSCCDSHICLGIQVMATDVSNGQLQDTILFYSDRLAFVTSDGLKEEKNCCSSSTNSCISNGAAVNSIKKFAYSPQEPAVNSIKKFAYSPQERNSGGWRTTNSKMR